MRNRVFTVISLHLHPMYISDNFFLRVISDNLLRISLDVYLMYYYISDKLNELSKSNICKCMIMDNHSRTWKHTVGTRKEKRG